MIVAMYKHCMSSKKFKPLMIELSKDDYEKLQSMVNSGKYITKVAVIRDLLKRMNEGD